MKSSDQSISLEADELLLQVTAPRMPRHLIERERLMTAELLQDYPVILVRAPAGYGKTSLLLQWRQRYLGYGAVVAWITSQVQNDSLRFAQALALSVRQSAARPNFDRLRRSAATRSPLDLVTGWLAQIVQLALDVVLIIDEADRLPVDTTDLLSFLLHNAPPNLRVIVAGRSDMMATLKVGNLADYGHCRIISPDMLQFQLDETVALIGTRMDHDSAVCLHELVDGWPLGIQLALTAKSSEGEPTFNPERHSGILLEPMIRLLLANLDAADFEFLKEISILDVLEPKLCQAVTLDSSTHHRLDRLIREIPIFKVVDDGKSVRMHRLMRDALYCRLQAAERAELHARAAAWLADNHMLEAAGRHALFSGKSQWAYDLAERSLYDDLMTYGRHGAVLEWLEGLPGEALDSRPHLMMTAAWVLAASGQPAEGTRLAERILARDDIDEAIRCECSLIIGSAAAFSDDPDLFSNIVGQWVDKTPRGNPVLPNMLRSMTAFRDILLRTPALVRLRHASEANPSSSRSYAARWGEYVSGLAFLREGQVLMAERQLSVTLALAEADFGRRSPFACMVAAVFAAALYEMGRSSDAAITLANRLDILDKYAYPEPMILAYRTLTRLALADGKESEALHLQNCMYVIGVARDLPILCVASLTEQIRIHSHRFRADTCSVLVSQIETFLKDPALRRGPLWWRDVDVLRNLAHAYTAIASREWRRSLDPILRGDVPALLSSCLDQHVEFLGLQAMALDQCGEDSRALLSEALDLAKTYGYRRIFLDAHPALFDLIRRVQMSENSEVAQISIRADDKFVERPKVPHFAASTALTPKEREVLLLLAHSLSNKEIGMAMQVSEQTIKWHIKNLFIKLDAGTRKQVVDRARMLGFLQEGDER